MAPKNLTSHLISEHLKFNFARPHAFIQTSPPMPPASYHGPRTSTIVIIHLVVVGLICLLLVLGVYMYRRHVRDLPKCNLFWAPSKSQSSMDNRINFPKEHDKLHKIDEKIESTPTVVSTEHEAESNPIDVKLEHPPKIAQDATPQNLKTIKEDSSES